MPLVKKLRDVGAKGVVTAVGEALFAPQTDVSRWKNRFSTTLRHAGARHAPSHDYSKRPLRPHPGPRLKESFRGRAHTDLTKGGGRFHVAMGSLAGYALYVDQGTGVYGEGNGLYLAKLLPPTAEGAPNLYERSKNMPDVWISGQRGQGFMEKALEDAMQRMLTPASRGGGGITAMRAALKTFPANLFEPGNTPMDAGLKARRAKWRRWRDMAYEAKRERQREISHQKWKERQERKAADEAARKARKAKRSDTAEDLSGGRWVVQRGKRIWVPNRPAQKGAPGTTRAQRLAEANRKLMAERDAKVAKNQPQPQKRAEQKKAQQKKTATKANDKAKKDQRKREKKDKEIRETQTAAETQVPQYILNANETAENSARTFLSKIKRAGAQAFLYEHEFGDGTVAYRVKYRFPGGKVEQAVWGDDPIPKP